MATANNAYMMWRQFSGQPRVSKGTEGPGYRAQAQNADVNMGTSVAQRLAEFASSATTAFNTMKESEKSTADQKVNAWMKDKTIEQYRAEMRAGNVPFQDDAVAMAVLHNKSAYTAALQVESDVEEKIAQGKFKTVEEADEFRIKALNASRKDFAAQIGLTAESPAFISGFDRDQAARREVLVRLQTDVTNKRLSMEGFTAAKADIVAPLKEIMASRGVDGAVSYILSSSNMADKTGLTRSDSDRINLIGHAVESLADTQGGADVLEQLGSKSIKFNGQDTHLRSLLGGGKFDLAVVQARTREQERDGNAFAVRQAQYAEWLSNDDDAAAQKALDESLVKSRGERTPEVERNSHVLNQIKANQQRKAEVARAELAKQIETDTRQRGAMETISGVISGTITSPINATPEGLGLKDKDELITTERRMLDAIPEGPGKDATILKMAVAIPNGYAFGAVKAGLESAERDWAVMGSQIASGKVDVRVPKSVEQVQAWSQIDPSAAYAVNNGKKPDFMTAIEAGNRIGVTPADVAVAQAAWRALPEQDRNKKIQALGKGMASGDVPLNTRTTETLQTFAGHYMALGLPPDAAIKQAQADFKDQNVVFPNMAGSAHKSFFQFDGSRRTFEAGKASFDSILDETTKGWGTTPDAVLIDYSPDDQTTNIRHVKTGESRKVTQPDIRTRYEEIAAKAQKEAEAKVKATVKEEAKRQRLNKSLNENPILGRIRPGRE